MKMLKYILLISVTIGQCFALEIGECLADPQSKRYLNPDFSAPYPRKISFSCEYECMGNESTTIIKALRTVEVRSIADEARIPVCLGVEVKQTNWGYDFDRVDPFF